MQSTQLKTVLEAGALLAGSARSEGATKLEDVLKARLQQYRSHIGLTIPETPGATLDDLQVDTACEALSVLEQVQSHLSGKIEHGGSSDGSTQEELLGSRDLVQIRTLLSLVFKWAIDPCLRRLCASIHTSTIPGSRHKADANIIDLTTVPDDYNRLKDTVLRLIHMILPEGIQGAPHATVLSSLILDKHLEDLLRPSMALGWLPKSSASESVLPVDDLRPMVVRLLLMLVAH